MADRELLELAAKAAGYKFSDLEFQGEHGLQLLGNPGQQNWNPLTDDGDALRLAVYLNLLPHIAGIIRAHDARGELSGCMYADVRRAIVRAAAEIGRAM
jgi:hypothetical protein